MATGRSRTLGFCLLVATLGPIGCAGQNPFTARQASVGTLKASVSQLEFENEKLSREVGELKADNARLETRLTQESVANGELTARLDDAKDLLRRQGGNTAQAMGGSSSSRFDDEIPPPVSTPKPRRINSRRSPSVSIPNPEGGANSEDLGYIPRSQTSRDVGPDLDQEERWLPVARGLGSQVRQ